MQPFEIVCRGKPSWVGQILSWGSLRPDRTLTLVAAIECPAGTSVHRERKFGHIRDFRSDSTFPLHLKQKGWLPYGYGMTRAMQVRLYSLE